MTSDYISSQFFFCLLCFSTIGYFLVISQSHQMPSSFRTSAPAVSSAHSVLPPGISWLILFLSWSLCQIYHFSEDDFIATIWVPYFIFLSFISKSALCIFFLFFNILFLHCSKYLSTWDIIMYVIYFLLQDNTKSVLAGILSFYWFI